MNLSAEQTSQAMHDLAGMIAAAGYLTTANLVRTAADSMDPRDLTAAAEAVERMRAGGAR